ncbi:hypothetical protein [Streptomyces sp. NPDC051662]|uniref:hypothetical protein n=1 Tax=Streptomyces sp. NPDC051662 TaxID=3154750 RepID=UPI00341DF16D
MMSRWMPSRQSPPPAAAVQGPPAPSGPNGFWLVDPSFRDRLASATLALLDLVGDALNDDIPLAEALDDAHDHVEYMLGVPSLYGVLVQAEAAAQIVQAAGLEAGSPFGLAIAQGLAGIGQLPFDQQQQFVRAASRRYAITAPSRSAASAPPASSHPGTAC